MFHLTQPRRRRPRYDEAGKLIGYVEASPQLEGGPADAPEAPSALGKEAFETDGRAVGKVTDIIFEAESGDVFAYELTDETGTAYYLKPECVSRETAGEVYFPPEAARPLGDWEISVDDPNEFSVVEEFPETE